MSAEERLDVLMRLADDLAHEIKNPLHAAVINIEVLRRRLARVEGSGEGERIAEIVATELERAGRRMELLLRLVRPERQHVRRLDEVVSEVAEVLGLVAAHRRQHFTLSEADGAGGSAGGSTPPGELRHRLLTAALEVMEREGVRSLALEVRGGRDGPRAVFSASDAEGRARGEALTVDLLDPGRKRELFS
jgi:signal transduction histidine kinase